MADNGDQPERLSVAEAMWLYRRTFPDHAASFTKSQRNEIRDEFQALLIDKTMGPDVAFARYRFSTGDGPRKAANRARAAFNTLMLDGVSYPHVRGPVLQLRSDAMHTHGDGSVDTSISALRARRIEAGLTQEDLEQLTGISRGKIGQLENSRTGMTDDELMSLSSALRCDPTHLLGHSRVVLTGESTPERTDD